jgi:hypothetical protein
MEDYTKILDLAEPYYRKGRPSDLLHIDWMMNAANLVCFKEGIDSTILQPLVILHDVGYSMVPNFAGFSAEVRKKHMEEGAKIAQEILHKLNYPKEKAEKIVHYVSVHDNWALGDNDSFNSDKVLGTFSDLDYIWMVTPSGFSAVRQMLKKSPYQMLEYIVLNDKPRLRHFCTKTTAALYEQYLEDRQEELKPGKVEEEFVDEED